jgi:hypothetical protein
MPVLPIIDLLIFLGWTTLAAGGLLKAIYIATSYRPTLFSLTPADLLLVALAFLGLALTLAARTWVKLNEPRLLGDRRTAASREAMARAAALDQAAAAQPQGAPAADSLKDYPNQWQRVR